MINLLPKEYELQLNKEYRVRRLIVICGFLVAITFVSLILLFPAYFLAKIKEKDVAAQSEILQQKSNNGQEITNIPHDLSAASKTAIELEKAGGQSNFYSLIHILQSKSPSI